jgi:hypothetical protein
MEQVKAAVAEIPDVEVPAQGEPGTALSLGSDRDIEEVKASNREVSEVVPAHEKTTDPTIQPELQDVLFPALEEPVVASREDTLSSCPDDEPDPPSPSLSPVNAVKTPVVLIPPAPKRVLRATTQPSTVAKTPEEGPAEKPHPLDPNIRDNWAGSPPPPGPPPKRRARVTETTRHEADVARMEILEGLPHEYENRLDEMKRVINRLVPRAVLLLKQTMELVDGPRRRGQCHLCVTLRREMLRHPGGGGDRREDMERCPLRESDGMLFYLTNVLDHLGDTKMEAIYNINYKHC